MLLPQIKQNASPLLRTVGRCYFRENAPRLLWETYETQKYALCAKLRVSDCVDLPLGFSGLKIINSRLQQSPQEVSLLSSNEKINGNPTWEQTI